MFRFLKLFFGIVFLFLTILLVAPLFIDKQNFIKLFEDKINSELNGEISFNQDIGVTFLPFPTVKINSLKYSDNQKIDLNIKKMNISISWASIFDLKPEITNMEIFSPNLKVFKNKKLSKTQNLKINISNKDEFFFKKVKKISKKFQIIKINDGLIKFENKKNFNVKNFNAVLKGKDGLSANGKLNLENLNLKVIFDFINIQENEFDLIIQTKVNEKNKLDFSGKINFFNNDYSLDGKIKSDFLNLNELLFINKQLTTLNKNNHILINAINNPNKKINFYIKSLLVKDILFKETKFTVLDLYPIFRVENFVSKFENSSITGLSLINLKTNKVTGELNIDDFQVKENYFGKTKYDLLEGVLNCSLKFNYLIGKYKNNLKSFLSNGTCKTEKIKLKGVNIDKIAKKIDNIKNFSSLINIFNSTTFEGNSIIDFVKINFLTKNGFLQIKDGTASHKNIELKTNGNFNIINDNFSFKTNAYFKTNKFKKLPALGINISGKINDYKVKYDFEALKQELFNKGIENILKENKSIIIDPSEIKKLFDKKSINPDAIFDLFKN